MNSSKVSGWQGCSPDEGSTVKGCRDGVLTRGFVGLTACRRFNKTYLVPDFIPFLHQIRDASQHRGPHLKKSASGFRF